MLMQCNVKNFSAKETCPTTLYSRILEKQKKTDSFKAAKYTNKCFAYASDNFIESARKKKLKSLYTVKFFFLS